MQVQEKRDSQSTVCGVCGAQNRSTSAACSTCGTTLVDGRRAPHTHISTLPAGTVLQDGKYIAAGVLGQGGFGITYQGRDTSLGRAVAIKEFFPSGCHRFQLTVLPDATQDVAVFQASRLRFIEEARTLARFRHPGIVDVYAVFEENDTAYMVMEYLSGQTLLQVLAARGVLGEDEAVSLITKVGEALAAVHEVGLLHRDLKPENMILRGDDVVRDDVVLIDFGTAREFAPDRTRRMTTTVTPGYAPLEQYGQQARFGAFTDIYALGATLYHLLTGQAPVQAPDRASGVELIEPRVLNPKLSQKVNAAILWALQTNVKERPQSVREFLESLTSGKPEPVSARDVKAATSTKPTRDFTEPAPAPKIDVVIPAISSQIQRQPKPQSPALFEMPKQPELPGRGKTFLPQSSALWSLMWGGILAVCLVTANYLFRERATVVALNSSETAVIDKGALSNSEPQYITNKIPLQQKTPGALKLVKVSPDGNMIVGMRPGWSLQSWDARTGKQIDAFSTGDGTTLGFLFSPDGKWIAGMDEAKGARWSEMYPSQVGSGGARWLAQAPPQERWTTVPAIAPISFSGAGGKKELAVACGNVLGQVIFNSVNGHKRWVLEVKPKSTHKAIDAVALSPDGSLLAVGTYEGAQPIVQVWDVASKKQKLFFSVRDKVEQLLFSPTGMLAVRTAAHIEFRDAHSGERAMPADPTGVTAVSFSPDGRTVAVAWRKSVEVWSTRYSGQIESQTIKEGEIADVAFTPDSRTVVFATCNPPAVYRWKLK